MSQNLLKRLRLYAGILLIICASIFYGDGNSDRSSLQKFSSKLKANFFLGGFDEPRLLRSEGLAYFEPWGQWSELQNNLNNEVNFSLTDYVPNCFILELRVKAFGPNTKLPTEVIIGNQSRSLIIESEEFKTYRLRFENVDYGVSTIKIIPPRPISPAEVSSNNNGDQRRIGVGFSSIKILSTRNSSRAILIYPPLKS